MRKVKVGKGRIDGLGGDLGLFGCGSPLLKGENRVNDADDSQDNLNDKVRRVFELKINERIHDIARREAPRGQVKARRIVRWREILKLLIGACLFFGGIAILGVGLFLIEYGHEPLAGIVSFALGTIVIWQTLDRVLLPDPWPR